MFRILSKGIEEKRIVLPSSKSVTHRALILGALNSGKTVIKNPLKSEDTEITLNALKSFGAEIAEKENEVEIVSPIGRVTNNEIYLGNSGSSARFLIPLVTHLDKPVKFSGTEELHGRPFAELFDILRRTGMKIEAENNSLPAIVYPEPEMKPGKYGLSKLPSSQIVSGLMMTSALLRKPFELLFSENLPSFPYIKLTQKMMSNFGLNVKLNDDSVIVIPEPLNYQWRYSCEKDMSAASYWVAYAMINRSRVRLPETILPTLQGDEEIFTIAEKLGSGVVLEKDEVIIEGKINSGLDWDCEAIPDIVPTLAVIALFAPAPFTLRNVHNLKFKESDRIEAITENIKRLGGEATYADGTLTVFPLKHSSPAIINSFDDHRIAMSFAVAGTRLGNVTIDNPECVSKSYPEFWTHLTEWEKVFQN